MRRFALVGVLALLGGALVLGSRGAQTDVDPAPARPDVAALQASLALPPCPTALSPVLQAGPLPCLGGGPAVEVGAGGPGRPTVLNFWAVWCTPCQREMPLLVDLHRRAGPRLGVVGVATQSPQEEALYFSRDFGMRFPSVVDDGGVLFREFSGGLPVTLFLRADGSIAHREVGELDDAAQLDGLVQEHLGVRL